MYNPKLLKPYLKAKFDNNIEVKNKELYLLCSCEVDDQKSSVRALKSKFLKEFRNASNGETNGETNESSFTKKSNNNITPGVKDRFHDQPRKPSKYHILSLLEKYPELPLFIYSKLFERVNKEYKIISNKPMNEMDDYEASFNLLTYSFYDMYMELLNKINSGKLNTEIEKYMKDVLQSYGNTYCYDRVNLPFDKAKLEEVTYWSEEKAKEYVKRMINIVHPKQAKEYNYSEEKIQELNEWAIEHAKSRVEEGIYEVEYSYVVEKVSDAITKAIESIPYMLNLYDNIDTLNYATIRIIPLIYLMFDYEAFNIFDDRPKEYIRSDLLKLYIEMNRNRIPLSYIPVSIDYQDEINNIYDIYREYDTRLFGMNEPEKFLQYKIDPTIQEKDFEVDESLEFLNSSKDE